MALFTIETEGQGDHVLWRENKPQKKYWDQLGFEPTLTAKPLGPRQRSGSKAAYSNAGWGTLPISSCLSLSHGSFHYHKWRYLRMHGVMGILPLCIYM